MRVLFTVQPSTGHLNPLVPVANALRDAGHDVAVCSAPAFKPDVEAFGLTHIDAGLDWLTSDHSTWTSFPPMPAPGPEFAKFVVTVFADVTTEHMVPDLLRVADAFRPDLIVRESMEYGGCIAAEVLGIPHASIAGNAYSAVDSPDVAYFPGNRRAVAEPLAHHRERFGLEPDPDIEMPFRYAHLAFTPPSWDGRNTPRPANTHFFRHVNTVQPGETPPSDARPLVFASLGTVFNNTPDVLEAIVAALATENVKLIVAIGRDGDPSRFGNVPESVHLEPYVAQPKLLERCNAFVTHGGFNSVKESLIAGVPMVLVPITADQPYSAARCSALGVGLTVEDRSAQTIRDATMRVLGEPSYRARAERFRDEMNALPGPDRVVELLESVANREATDSQGG